MRGDIGIQHNPVGIKNTALFDNQICTVAEIVQIRIGTIQACDRIITHAAAECVTGIGSAQNIGIMRANYFLYVGEHVALRITAKTVPCLQINRYGIRRGLIAYRIEACATIDSIRTDPADQSVVGVIAG